MDCARSLELLSDFRIGALDEAGAAFVRTHLSSCIMCSGVFKDLEAIVSAAAILRSGDDLAFPDENVLWQRMGIVKRAIH